MTMVPANILINAKAVLLALNRTGVRYALCGGLAMSVHATPRATKDIDILIAAESDLTAIDAALEQEGWITTSSPIDFPGGFRLHRRIRFIEGRSLILDLLIAPPGDDLLAGRFLGQFDHCAAWIISREALIRMKRAAGRPRDLADIADLEAT